jgi:hypothetical protein
LTPEKALDWLTTCKACHRHLPLRRRLLNPTDQHLLEDAHMASDKIVITRNEGGVIGV